MHIPQRLTQIKLTAVYCEDRSFRPQVASSEVLVRSRGPRGDPEKQCMSIPGVSDGARWNAVSKVLFFQTVNRCTMLLSATLWMKKCHVGCCAMTGMCASREHVQHRFTPSDIHGCAHLRKWLCSPFSLLCIQLGVYGHVQLTVYCPPSSVDTHILWFRYLTKYT